MDKFGYNVPPKTQRVVCNCGKETIIIMNPLNNAYRPEDKSWKFRAISRPYGWYCGTEGHLPRVQNISKEEESND